MTPKQELLHAIREFSESQWACGWYSGIEFILWKLVCGEVATVGHMTGRKAKYFAAYLKELAEESGGWWSWSDGWEQPQPVFIGMEEWLKIVAEKKEK